MTYDIDIGGYNPEAVFGVDVDPPGGSDLSEATIRMGSTPANRENIEYGDRITLHEDGEYLFSGYITSKLGKNTDGVLEATALDDRVQLRHERADRVFYAMDSAEAVSEAVEYEAVQLDERVIVTGDDLDAWSGDVDVLNNYRDGETDEIPSRSLYEVGDDMVYLGMEAEDDRDETGVYRATRTDLSDDVVGAGGDGQLRELHIRYALSNIRGEVNAELELRANGRNYVWSLAPTNNLETAELNAADADPDGELESGPVLEIRFDIDGSLDEAFGMLLDGVWTVPFHLKKRDSDITVGEVEPTGRTITREHTGTVLSFVNDMASEDGWSVIVDADRELDYTADGGEDRDDLDIVQGETAVVDVEFDRDAEELVNRVQVNGDGVRVTVEDPASIAFYGVAPRQEPITDPSIKTEAEAEAKGRGELAENAWADTVATFSVADRRYSRLSPEDTLVVYWPSQDFETPCVVRGVSTTEEGIAELNLGVVN